MGESTMITPQELRRAEFHTTRWHEGYDTDEVDEIIEEAAETIETLTRVLESIVTTKGNTND